MSDRPSFDLIAQPSIISVQQLRGKKIGIGGIGGLPEILIRQILSANQIPADQVTFASARCPRRDRQAFKGSHLHHP